MEEIKRECKSIIDNCFSEIHFAETGNKIADQLSKAKSLKSIVEKASDLCVDYLNTINPSNAKKFARSGFINEYVMEKQQELLGL